MPDLTQTALGVWGTLTVIFGLGAIDLLPIRGKRPLTKALWFLCFLPGAVPYLVGRLVAWSLQPSAPEIEGA